MGRHIVAPWKETPLTHPHQLLPWHLPHIGRQDYVSHAVPAQVAARVNIALAGVGAQNFVLHDQRATVVEDIEPIDLVLCI